MAEQKKAQVSPEAEMFGSLRVRLVGMRSRFPDQLYALDMWQLALQELDGAASRAGDRGRGAVLSNAIPYWPDACVERVKLAGDDLVVDVGCLSGYGLFDFAVRTRRAGGRLPRMLGVDTDARANQIARELAADWGRNPSVKFETAAAEQLPVDDARARVVIARLLLPYVDVDATLREIARVLQPGGWVLLQTHGLGYYLRQAWLNRLNVPRLFYYLRPVLVWPYVRLTGRLPKRRHWREAALQAWDLNRLARRAGLRRVWRDAGTLKPMALFQKPAPTR